MAATCGETYCKMWVGGRVGIMAGQLVVGWLVLCLGGWVVVVLGVVVMLASGLLSPPEVSGSPSGSSSGSSRPHGLHSVRPLPGGRPGRNLQRESATERVSSRESVAVSKRVSERVSWGQKVTSQEKKLGKLLATS